MLSELAKAVRPAIRARLQNRNGQCPLIVGICGAQGSGKSTLTAQLAQQMTHDGYRVAAVSLDDLYLSHEQRADLSQTVHPLFATRGVPGTHDVDLGLQLFEALKAGKSTSLPRFDKARDTAVPNVDWPLVEGPVDLVLFEGWCVGAHAQNDNALASPINKLEQSEDDDRIWRRTSNAALAGPYQKLFSEIDMLILLAAPSFDVVAGWRTQQEHDLHARTGQGMTDAQIARFVLYYERITRHILETMPDYADLVAYLRPDRSIDRIVPALNL